MPLPLDMPSDEFKRAGARAVSWISDYLSHPEGYPVLSRSEPGDLKSRLPASPPRGAESMDAILDDFERLILPGITHWNHPGFHAYFSITGSAPGILGELYSAALNINGMLWQTSPAATELEEVVLDWLRQLIGLPDAFRGVIIDTASVGVACALAAARHAQTDLRIRDAGMAGRDLPRLRAYTSEHAHSSVEKAGIFIGLGRENVRKISTDAEYRLDESELTAAIAEDRAAGFRPFCILATVGTTSTSSVDPVPAIAAICEREKLWLHVDAAYAGPAAIVPRHREILAGCDRADSFIINPHKWLFTPIDCSVLYLRDPDGYTDAFSLLPEYLRTGVDEDVTNYMDWGIALGRRFRALKLWMVLRYFGADRLSAIIESHIDFAAALASWIDDDPDFERLAPAPFSLICFRARPRTLVSELGGSGGNPKALEEALEAFNQRLLEGINRSGRIYLSHTKLRGRYTLRFAIGNLRTTEKHIEEAWKLIRSEARRLAEE